MELAHSHGGGKSSRPESVVIDLEPILSALRKSNKGGMTSHEIAEELGCSKSKAIQVIKDACRRGILIPGRESRWEEWCQKHISYVVYRRAADV